MRSSRVSQQSSVALSLTASHTFCVFFFLFSLVAAHLNRFPALRMLNENSIKKWMKPKGPNDVGILLLLSCRLYVTHARKHGAHARLFFFFFLGSLTLPLALSLSLSFFAFPLVCVCLWLARCFASVWRVVVSFVVCMQFFFSLAGFSFVARVPRGV